MQADLRDVGAGWLAAATAATRLNGHGGQAPAGSGASRRAAVTVATFHAGRGPPVHGRPARVPDTTTVVHRPVISLGKS